jgi:hypothetical protein
MRLIPVLLAAAIAVAASASAASAAVPVCVVETDDGRPVAARVRPDGRILSTVDNGTTVLVLAMANDSEGDEAWVEIGSSTNLLESYGWVGRWTLSCRLG